MLCNVLQFWKTRGLGTGCPCKTAVPPQAERKSTREQSAASRDGVFTSVDVGNYA
jgi:hypothetical protein